MLKKIKSWCSWLWKGLLKPLVWVKRFLHVLWRPLQAISMRGSGIWQNMLAPCATWWGQREPRERKLISYGGSAAIIFIIYIAAWVPLTAAVQKQMQVATQNMQSLIWLRSVLPHVQTYQKQGWHLDQLPPAGGKKVIHHFMQQLKVSLSQQQLSDFVSQIKVLPQQETVNLKNLLQAKQIKPLIELHFAAVPFAAFERWLQKFSKQQHVALASLHATKSQPDGTAHVVLQLGV